MGITRPLFKIMKKFAYFPYPSYKFVHKIGFLAKDAEHIYKTTLLKKNTRPILVSFGLETLKISVY